MEETRFYELLSKDNLKSTVCRLCLSEDDMVYNIYEHSFKEYNTIYELLSQLSIQMSCDDSYPNVICEKCLDFAAMTLDFKIMCNNSYLLLGTYFNKLQEKVKTISETGDGIVKNENSILFLIPEYDISMEELSNTDILFKNEIIVKTQKNVEESVLTASNDKCILDKSNCQKYTCPTCNVSFLSVDKLQRHVLSKVHGFQCNICYQNFNVADRLKNHLSMHLKKKESYCHYCGDFLVKEVHTTKLFKYSCDICKQKYPCSLFLDNHIERAHINPKPVDERIKEKGETGKIFVCNYCGKKFSKSKMYYKHINTHNKLFICDYCGENHRDKGKLQRHINKHLGLKPYVCQICNKGFYSYGELHGHTIVHTRERRFQCDLCGNKFVTNKAMQYHRRLHTGEKPYKCELCDERFLSSSRRSMHFRMEHMKKAKCPICLGEFSHQTISRHIIRHSNTTVKNPRLVRVIAVKEEEIIN